jgi:hypothetical protein
MKQAPVSVETGVVGVIDKIDNATREETSGAFISGQSSDPPLGW